MGSRTDKVIFSNECRVLRDLRRKSGLSMNQAGALLGFSDSYVSQIENGRANIPKGEALMNFLKIYGDITPKYFGELCRGWQTKKTDADLIRELLPKLKREQLKLLRTMAEQLAKGIE